MASRSTAERPPRHPGLSFVRQKTGGSYVQRFKIQRERIKTLHPDDKHSSEKGSEKTLPKISQARQGVTREETGVKRFIRSNTLDKMKLPGVSSGSAYALAARRRQPVPLKTFNMRLNPEHASFISKSLPSLPSIPGSPPPNDPLSPVSERRYELKPSIFPAKRYQKIAFQKILHDEKVAAENSTARSLKDYPSKDMDYLESIYSNAMPQRAFRHKVKFPTDLEGERDKEDLPPKSKSTISYARHRRYSKDSAISDTRSEGNYLVAKKWKDDCECLRCQMLRREYHEGDEHYKLWGQYPCHRIDPTVRLNEDD